MQKQTAVLVHHQGEWVLVADDDESERVWQDGKRALADLQAEGWEVTAGSAPVEPDVPGLA